MAIAMASEGTTSRVLDLAMDHDDAVSRVPAPTAAHDRGRGEQGLGPGGGGLAPAVARDGVVRGIGRSGDQ